MIWLPGNAPATGEVLWRMPGNQFSGMATDGSTIFYATWDELGVWEAAIGNLRCWLFSVTTAS